MLKGGSMSVPRSSASIEFPFSLIDSEIRKVLEDEGVNFKPRVFGPIMELDEVSGNSLELDSPLYDLETEINEEGIFRLHNPEARYGEFGDLEELLVKKGIPFDRDSAPDWQRPAVLRVFRPASGDLPVFDQEIAQDESIEVVARIRGILGKMKYSPPADSMSEWDKALRAIMNYLEEVSPTNYQSLEDWVKQENLRSWAINTSKVMSALRGKEAKS
jgi:hypothetical protein